MPKEAYAEDSSRLFAPAQGYGLDFHHLSLAMVGRASAILRSLTWAFVQARLSSVV